ncbi:MAG: Rrf2 family transcriptional regulator, partial [Actinobacteria bacterium]
MSGSPPRSGSSPSPRRCHRTRPPATLPLRERQRTGRVDASSRYYSLKSTNLIGIYLRNNFPKRQPSTHVTSARSRRIAREGSPVGPPRRQNEQVYISAKADYVTRALLVMAAEPDGKPVTGAAIAKQQHMPMKFVE